MQKPASGRSGETTAMGLPCRGWGAWSALNRKESVGNSALMLQGLYIRKIDWVRTRLKCHSSCSASLQSSCGITQCFLNCGISFSAPDTHSSPSPIVYNNKPISVFSQPSTTCISATCLQQTEERKRVSTVDGRIRSEARGRKDQMVYLLMNIGSWKLWHSESISWHSKWGSFQPRSSSLAALTVLSRWNTCVDVLLLVHWVTGDVVMGRLGCPVPAERVFCS